MALRRRRAAATPARHLRPYFEFRVRGPAVSAQAKNKALLRAWVAQVGAAVRSAWPVGASPMTDDLDVHISEFSEFSTMDRDNLAKPLLDAMQGIVYEKDRQVKRILIEWCDIEGSYVVRSMSLVVAAGLSEGKEFLWVRVSPHAPREDLIR